MNLKIRDGQLTLGSVFRLAAVGWAVCGLIIFGGIFLLLLLIGIAGGAMLVNGETINGRGAVLMAMLPMIVILPVILALQAVMFGGMITGGAALYRLWRPLSVSAETTTPSPLP